MTSNPVHGQPIRPPIWGYGALRHAGDQAQARTVEILSQHLVDSADLLSQTRHATWIAKGQGFFNVHLLFDKLAVELVPYLDQMVDRITALGGIPHGTARMVAARSRLPEFPAVDDGYANVSALIDRYTAVAEATRQSRDGIGDSVGTSLLLRYGHWLDNAIRYLRAYLQD